jgi:hypothetical protein
MLGQNLLDFTTKGASQATASQDGLKAGIQASQKMAKTDWNRLLPYKKRFEDIATKHDINPAILLAIASRESRAGAALKSGWGDNNNAFGCCQVDKRYHNIVGINDPFSEEHINQATEILINFYNGVKNKHGWDEEWSLKGAIAAYNSGLNNVQSKEGLNRGTTGNDYADDVVARAQYYQQIQSPTSNTQPLTPITDNRTIITAVKDTWLKKEVKQFLELSEDKKKAIAQGVNYYVLRLVEVDNGHCQVELDYDAGTWFIFKEDWEIRKVGEPSKVTVVNPDRIEIKGSVGSGGLNNSTDVIIIKTRLQALGFNGFAPYTSMVDQKLIRAIKLFQSIIQGSTSLIGDGKIDPNGPTLRWLNASNAPRWGKLCPEGKGFINIEAIETWDFHDFGRSWLDQAIIEIGEKYENTYRKGNASISPMLVNDVSLKHGGDTPDHAGHETGNAVDLRLPTKGGDLQTVINTWNDIRYDRQAALALLRIINAHPLFKRAFFNDHQAIGAGLCSHANGHDNHIHFEIKTPAIVD